MFVVSDAVRHHLDTIMIRVTQVTINSHQHLRIFFTLTSYFFPRMIQVSHAIILHFTICSHVRSAILLLLGLSAVSQLCLIKVAVSYLTGDHS